MAFSVRIREPETMHVAGLVLARVLERAARGGGALALSGNIAIDAGGMEATLVGGEHGLEIARGLVPPLAASIRAPLRTLLGIAAGGSVVRALFGGGLRARGSLRALFALRRLMKAARHA
jgi:hypothetical protein